jgi:hypothetical protein
MLNTKRFMAVAMVLMLATGVSFAYTDFVNVPPTTAPLQTDGIPDVNASPTGGLTFYTDEAAFLADAGAVTSEDFSCTTAEPGGVCSGPTPMNSSTNDGCFNACLAEGFEGIALGVGDYAAAGTGFLGLLFPVAGPNTFTDEWDYNFDPAASAVGFTVIGDLINNVDVDLTYLDSRGGTLGAATVHGVLAGTFIGAISGGSAIASVEVREQVDGSADLFGGLHFSGGGGGDPPGTPASSTWGMIALIAMIMAGSLFYMRRRAEA